jgi:hypothetical protein
MAVILFLKVLLLKEHIALSKNNRIAIENTIPTIKDISKNCASIIDSVILQ